MNPISEAPPQTGRGVFRRGEGRVRSEAKPRLTERAPIVGKRAWHEAFPLIEPLSGDWSSKDTPRSEPTMTLPRSVADVIAHHVTWQLEGIDRMYLNLYIPALQSEGGVVHFFRQHRRQPFASAVVMEPISKRFRAAVDAFVAAEGIPLVTFHAGERKEDIAAAHRARFQREEGIVFVGRAQEKTPVFRTEKRRNPRTGQTYPWLVRSTAMVNHFYFYCVDRDFGPF